jgi:hypothetical protein
VSLETSVKIAWKDETAAHVERVRHFLQLKTDEFNADKEFKSTRYSEGDFQLSLHADVRQHIPRPTKVDVLYINGIATKISLYFAGWGDGELKGQALKDYLEGKTGQDSALSHSPQ